MDLQARLYGLFGYVRHANGGGLVHQTASVGIHTLIERGCRVGPGVVLRDVQVRNHSRIVGNIELKSVTLDASELIATKKGARLVVTSSQFTGSMVIPAPGESIIYRSSLDGSILVGGLLDVRGCELKHLHRRRGCTLDHVTIDGNVLNHRGWQLPSHLVATS